MGEVKSDYEKILEEFYEIEDIPEDELDLESLLGNEYRHVVNHFAAKKDINDISEGLLEEYDEALRELKSHEAIEIFNTEKPNQKFFFYSNAEVWDFIKKETNAEYIRQFRDPAEPDRMIIDYGSHKYFYIYKISTSKLD